MRVLTTAPGAPSDLPGRPFSVYTNTPASPTFSAICSLAVTVRLSPPFIRPEKAGSPSVFTDTQHVAVGAISIEMPDVCGAAAGTGAAGPGAGATRSAGLVPAGASAAGG